ncbi:transmembrane protein 44 isoform X2 [Genypterus blacodes]|uniref:transmembrane protein 44 isoform X2 n=1 Tax=Genypterus blacodes TaxID=154954 RepID=UPI003F760DA5
MSEHTQSSDGHIASTLDFTLDSFSACFSNGTDQRCVSIALGCVSALLLLLSNVVLITYQRCRTRAEDPGDSSTWLYCFLGHLCSTVGAVLSKQLHILVVMGAFAAALDGVIYVSFFPVCWRSEKERRRRVMMTMRKGRRRQQLLGVCVLMVLAGFLNSGLDPIPSERPVRDRRLLQIPMQDKTEILGYTLGLLSFVITCTSKFPSLNRSCFRGDAMTRVGVFSRVLWSLSSALFASAILLYNTGFTFVLRVLPWLLSAICAATLDLLILVIHWCMRGTKETPERFFPDTENLLEDWDASSRRQQEPQARLPINIKKHVQKMIEMGDYMDVTVQPSRKEVTVCGSTTEKQALNRMVKVVRLQGFRSSDSSCDSEDLEWDFEDPTSQSRATTSKQKERNDFPLQEWTSSPNPLNTCTCATSGPLQKPVSDLENTSGCVVSLDK